jgi:hypothetical protein
MARRIVAAVQRIPLVDPNHFSEASYGTRRGPDYPTQTIPTQYPKCLAIPARWTIT